MGIFDGIVGAVAGPLIGGLLGSQGQESANSTNVQIAQQTNDFNAQQAQLNRDFQQNMSNTAWQRGVKDMEAAGLNPMLAYGIGPASVPSGNAASGVSAHVENAMEPLARSISNVSTTAAQVENVHADTKVKENTADQVASQAELNRSLARKADQDTLTSGATAANLAIQSDVLRATVPKVVAETANIQSDTQRLVAITKQVDELTKNYPLERSQIIATIGQIYQLTQEAKGRTQSIAADLVGKQAAAESVRSGAPPTFAGWMPNVSGIGSTATGLYHSIDAILGTMRAKSRAFGGN